MKSQTDIKVATGEETDHQLETDDGVPAGQITYLGGEDQGANPEQKKGLAAGHVMPSVGLITP